MNKKKIGALLVGATLLVGAMGSFAYFTGRTNVIGGNNGGNLQAITITNGEVVVSAEVANKGQELSDWTYDVAKYSSDINPEQPGIQLPNKIGTEEAMSMTEFEKIHRSPDINALTKLADGNGDIDRAVIGSKFNLDEAIKFTRPGDAIVLGTAQSGTAKVNGLVVTNESNLTVKMQLVVKTDDNAKKMIEAMNEAGWVMYVDGEVATYTSGNKIDLGIVKPGDESTIVSDIRFELPLLTRNDKQNATNVNKEFPDKLDLSKIIEIQATQENNTGWNQDGTGDRINDDTEIK